MEELSERAKTLLVFDAYLNKVNKNLDELRTNFPEIRSVLQVASRLGGGEESNASYRVDLTMAVDYAVQILLKDDENTEHRLSRFIDTIEEIKKLLDPEDVSKIYDNATYIAKQYEEHLQKAREPRLRQKILQSKPKRTETRGVSGAQKSEAFLARKYKSIDPEKVTVPKLENEPKPKKPKEPTITQKPSKTVRKYMDSKREEKNSPGQQKVLPLLVITEEMIAQLGKIKKDIQTNPEKYPYTKQHKKYFKAMIEDYQYMLRGGHGPSLAEQEKNDAKFSNDIEILVNNIINGWAGAREELRTIKTEFNAALDYDPGKLMEYLGLEMVALRIIKKNELPNGMITTKL